MRDGLYKYSNIYSKIFSEMEKHSDKGCFKTEGYQKDRSSVYIIKLLIFPETGKGCKPVFC
jgi:hypothetical protein